jgi:hypothetical protein
MSVIARRRPFPFTLLAAVLPLAAMVAGCDVVAMPPARNAAEAAVKNLDASDYYPMDAGWKWAYDLEKDGQKILAMYAVLERLGEIATVQAGDDRMTYSVTAEGLAQQDGPRRGDFVLRNPIALGNAWQVEGGTAKIVSVGQEVTTDAGRFVGCVVVEVMRALPNRLARTTFAPGVGPLQIEYQVQNGGRFETVMRATLRGLTKPGEDPLAVH